MVQLVLRAASQNHACPYATTRTDCDNRGVVQHGNTPKRAQQAKQAQADVLRRLKQQITHYPFLVDYQWVPAHQDDHRKWSELTLREKMNVIVDKLAKLAIIAGVVDQDFIDRDLPFKQVRVTLDGHKVAGPLRKAINRH